MADPGRAVARDGRRAGRVVVNGSGIAGAAVALLLARAGHRVHLIERHPEALSHEGADVLKPSGLAVLQDLDLIDEVFAIGGRRRSQLNIYFGGELLHEVRYAEQHDGPIRYFVTIPRGQVVSLLRGRLRMLDGVVLHDRARITAVTRSDGQVEAVTLDDGTHIACDVLIGADGFGSYVRRTMGIADTRELYAAPLVYGTIAETNSSLAVNRLYFDDRRGMVYVYPITRSGTRLVMAFPEEELRRYTADASGASLRRRVGELVGEHSADILPHIHGPGLFRRIPVARGNAPRYAIGNCALAGDAAHQIHPITGQGMNLALEDVAELAGQLVACDWTRGGIAGALRRYEAVRRPIDAAVIAYGDRLATHYHDRAKLRTIFDPRTQSSARGHLTRNLPTEVFDATC